MKIFLLENGKMEKDMIEKEQKLKKEENKK